MYQICLFRAYNMNYFWSYEKQVQSVRYTPGSSHWYVSDVTSAHCVLLGDYCCLYRNTLALPNMLFGFIAVAFALSDRKKENIWCISFIFPLVYNWNKNRWLVWRKIFVFLWLNWSTVRRRRRAGTLTTSPCCMFTVLDCVDEGRLAAEGNISRYFYSVLCIILLVNNLHVMLAGCWCCCTPQTCSARRSPWTPTPLSRTVRAHTHTRARAARRK